MMLTSLLKLTQSRPPRTQLETRLRSTLFDFQPGVAQDLEPVRALEPVFTNEILATLNQAAEALQNMQQRCLEMEATTERVVERSNEVMQVAEHWRTRAIDSEAHLSQMQAVAQEAALEVSQCFELVRAWKKSAEESVQQAQSAPPSFDQTFWQWERSRTRTRQSVERRAAPRQPLAEVDPSQTARARVACASAKRDMSADIARLRSMAVTVSRDYPDILDLAS